VARSLLHRCRRSNAASSHAGHAIAALTSLLGVDDEYTEQLDEVLIGMVGQGIDDPIAGEGIPAAGAVVVV